MKTWQKRFFRERVESKIPELIRDGRAITEDEAYSVFKYMCRTATRRISSSGKCIEYNFRFPKRWNK